MTVIEMRDGATLQPGRQNDSAQNNVDFARVMLAIVVIYSHSYPLSEPGGIDPVERVTLGQVSAGTAAVYVFFVLSGYLIAASLTHSPSASVFLNRRVRRIYPGFVVALAISAFAVTPLALPAGVPYFTFAMARHWVVSAVTLDVWWHPTAFPLNAHAAGVNGSLWTIRYEFACYLMLLGIGSVRSFKPILFVLFGVAVAANALACLHILPAPMITLGSAVISVSSALAFSSLFLAGAVAYHTPSARRYRVPVLVASLAGLGLAARLPHIGAFTLIAPLALSYVSLVASFAQTPAFYGFASRVGGDYSYGIYIYAFPIQQLVTMAFGGQMNPLLNFLIATPLAIAAGIASWHYVEKRYISRHRASAASPREIRDHD